MSVWRKLVLFGDSLTQLSFQESGWGAILADVLQRKADVLNRGFSGYNSKDGADMVEKVFPPGSLAATDLVTVCFGANDAVLPDHPQHIPCDMYATYLHGIVKYLIGLGIPEGRIILISPPPVDEVAWTAHLIKENLGTVTNRQNSITKKYADTCGKVASEYGCPFVNFWEQFMRLDDYKVCLDDGLHFSTLGNKFAAELLMTYVSKLTEAWPMNFPDWKDIHQ